jgi:hypothetical protein
MAEVPRDDTADERARYVVERLAEAVDGPIEADWTQIQKQLAHAYIQIRDAQRGYRLRAAVRPVLGLLLAYALVTALHWQIDSLWGARGVSPQTFYLPWLMVVSAPFLLITVAMAAVIASYFVVGFEAKDFKDDLVLLGAWTAILVVGAGGVVGITVMLEAVFDYTWPQAIAIATAEPTVWILLAGLIFSRPPTNRSARDPRAQLLADLTIFLAVAAIAVDQEGQERHDPRAWDFGGDFPPLRWPDIAYSTTLEDRKALSHSQPRHLQVDERGFPIVPAAAAATGPPADQGQAVDPLPKVMRVSADAWTWQEAPAMRRAFAEGIDLAAQRVESRLPRVIGRRQTAVRSAVSQLSARIAATLRTYAVDVTLGGDERDRGLPERLSAALVSASWGRWEDLAIADPQPAVERFVKRFGPRVGVAAVLVAAAVFAPIWFHGWLGDASAQFRIALVSAAVLGLTQAPRTAIERLTSSLVAVGRQ